MKILALEVEKQGLTSEDFEPYLEDEARKLWELKMAGAVRECYFRADRKTAVLVLECGNVDAAREIVSELPLVKAGLIHFDFIALKPYSGFERLF